ncbi:hypothetical protein [Cellulomonas chitinilytica]|nr:hypothetical protein [Cellulomonas chitinilytica]
MVDELQRAWRAVQDGRFRGRGDDSELKVTTEEHERATRAWQPHERVLPVVGCVGQAGSTTLALALATLSGQARVLECGPAARSGLADAATAELGASAAGWVVGRREGVQIARAGGARWTPESVPPPDDASTELALSVVDVGWDVADVLTAGGWLARHLAAAEWIVAATRATTPGLRQLETVLAQVGSGRVVAAVIGPPPRRWPRSLNAAIGPAIRALLETGDVVAIPPHHGLATRGLDPTPLPASVLRAAAEIARRISVSTDHSTKGF